MGILDAPAVSKKALTTAVRKMGGATRGMGIVSTRGCNLGAGILSNGTDTSGMYRFTHGALSIPVADIRLVYANWYGAQGAAMGDGPNAITVEASVEPPVNAYTGTMAASVYPVTFDGASTRTIQPGQFVISDPIPLRGEVGQIIYTNTYVSVTSGQKWPLGQNGIVAGATTLANFFEGGATGAPATKTTAGGSTPPATYISAFAPIAIIGTPQGSNAAPLSVFSFGDSILFGSHDATHIFDGWLGRSAVAHGAAYVNVSHPGDRASYVRGTGARQRLPLVTSCDVAVLNYGHNDLANNGGTALTDLYTDSINLWRDLAARNLRVYHTTLTPISVSTDNWITTANQTPDNTATANTNRIAFNAWLRDGAPVNSTTYAKVNVGGSGIRVGAAGHPLTGFIEVADTVETARDSGIWKAGRVVTDAVLTAASRNISSATAAWTAADVGQSVYVPSVGHMRIASVTSSTVAVYEGGGTVPSSLTGQTVGIGYYTDDGTHPTITGHRVLAAAINVGAL